MAGSIRKRKWKNGKVAWRARYPNPSKGGTAQIEKLFERRRDAERWLVAQRASVHRGEHVNPAAGRRSFAELAAAWRATWVELEPKTRAGYEGLLNAHVLPRWADVRLESVTPEAIQGWINELAAKRAPNTVRNVYSALRSVLNVAVERRYLAANPCDAVRLPRLRQDTGEMLFLGADEVAALADEITPHFRTLIYTAAYTGLRAGELAGLRRRDVDLRAGTLNVERALKEVNGASANITERGLIFGPPKGGRRRQVGLPKFLGDMLAAHLDRQVEPEPDALVFTSLEGAPLRQGNFYKRHFKPAVRAALPERLHGLRFHDLRHTAASLLIAAGAHPKAIQTHLGHKDIQTTLNVYGHLLPSVEQALTAALDATYAAAERPQELDMGAID
jgi:integrase